MGKNNTINVSNYTTEEKAKLMAKIIGLHLMKTRKENSEPKYLTDNEYNRNKTHEQRGKGKDVPENVGNENDGKKEQGGKSVGD